MTTSNGTLDQGFAQAGEHIPPMQQTKQSRAPHFIAYQVRKTSDGKGFWTRIGAAWMHEDKAGLNIQLESLPFGGAITLRLNAETKKQ